MKVWPGVDLRTAGFNPRSGRLDDMISGSCCARNALMHLELEVHDALRAERDAAAADADAKAREVCELAAARADAAKTPEEAERARMRVADEAGAHHARAEMLALQSAQLACATRAARRGAQRGRRARRRVRTRGRAQMARRRITRGA